MTLDGRLALVAGLFAIVFLAGVGQAFVAGDDATFSQVIDESVDGAGASDAAVTDGGADAGDGDNAGEDAAGDSGDGSGAASGGGAGASEDGGDDAGDGNESGSAEASGPPFRFQIDRIEKCDRTCRDVTATIVNGQNEPASNVVVETAIYAGNDTSDGDEVWEGSERVGRLAADGEHTSTQEVDLGWRGGLAVKSAGGWITVETVVESDDESRTIERQREVA